MPQTPFKKVAIIGVGLIGGSLGLALKKKGMAKEIWGVTKTIESAKAAIKLKAIDKSASLIQAIEGADLVILAAPVLSIVDHIKTISKNVNLLRGPVIDVGSSKTEIWDAAGELTSKGITFIGCHPMAGSEKRGVENASASLFDGSYCFVTDSPGWIVDFWTKVGVDKVLRFDPDTHDRFVAVVSHLTHLISFAMVSSLDLKKIGLNRRLINPSFRQMLRLAQSDPEVWADILVTNQEEIRQTLKEFKKGLATFEEKMNNRKEILKLLRSTKNIADKLAEK